MHKLVLVISIALGLNACQNNVDHNLEGTYIVYKFEQNDSVANTEIPKIELNLYSGKTFKLLSNGQEDSGTWEASTLKEFNNISFFFDKNRNLKSEANFDITEYATLIFILNPKDFFYPELRKLSLKKK